MKKILIALLFLTSLAGCSQKKETPSSFGASQKEIEEDTSTTMEVVLTLLDHGFEFNGISSFGKVDESTGYYYSFYFDIYFGHLLNVVSPADTAYQNYTLVYMQDLLSGENQDVGVYFYSPQLQFISACYINHSGNLNGYIFQTGKECSEEQVEIITAFQKDVVAPLLENAGVTLAQVSKQKDYVQDYFDYLVDTISESDKQAILNIIDSLLERGFYFSYNFMILGDDYDTEVIWLHFNYPTGKFAHILFEDVDGYDYDFMLNPPEVTFSILDQDGKTVNACIYFYPDPAPVNVNPSDIPQCDSHYGKIVEDAIGWMLESSGFSWDELFGIPYPYLDVYAKYK
ncbi:MAG: hypothetical protein LBR25_07140 [Erysipelotrichaceae bacterium]|nr:hypothetical protein [Erysipelotrichaceae bacterium]